MPSCDSIMYVGPPRCNQDQRRVALPCPLRAMNWRHRDGSHQADADQHLGLAESISRSEGPNPGSSM